MQLLNGKEVAAFHRERVERRLADIQEELHIQPELAIILVGEDAPSAIDRKSTRLNSSHGDESRMPSSA